MFISLTFLELQLQRRCLHLPFDTICRDHLAFVVQTVAVHPSVVSQKKNPIKRIIL
jgi:hypothetical protein